jgi:hypothetical protein
VRLRLRESAGRYFADVIAAVAPGAAVIEGHQAANRIEAAIETALPGSDVVVHVEPRRSGLDLRDRILAIALAEPLVKKVHDITIYEQNGSASVSLHLKFPSDFDLHAALGNLRGVARLAINLLRRGAPYSGGLWPCRPKFVRFAGSWSRVCVGGWPDRSEIGQNLDLDRCF